MDEENVDSSEIEDRAKKLADLTGRDYEDVLADLLDDGKLNQSNADSPDLVEQLKDAAELIATVQNISKDINDNTVLNGGDNETVLEVKTTLEGDIVDRAIESVQRKAENIKKILILLSPLFLLLGGGSLEAIGWIDLMGSESDDLEDDYPMEYWGCMNPDAINYDEYATHDDGSCDYDDNGGGGGPPVNCDWSWQDDSFMDNDNFLVVRGVFSSPNCPHEMEGDFTVELIKDNEYHDEEERNGIRFKQSYTLEHSFSDLEVGVYRNHFSFYTYDGSNWNWDSPETHEVFDDTCYSQTELDSPTLSSDGNDLIVDLVFSDLGGCGQDIEISMEVWNGGQLHDTLEYGEVHDGVFWIEPDGDTTMRVQGKAELSELPDGDDWIVKAKYSHANADDAPYESEWFESNSIVIDEVQDPVYGCTDSEANNYDSSATVDDESCEYEPEEPCEISIQNHYRGHVAEDEEQDAILVAFKVIPTNCEGEYIDVDIELYQNGYDANYTESRIVSGGEESDVSHIFDGVAVGNSWTPRITASLDSEVLEQVLFWGIDVVEQEPEICEINLFWIDIGTNATHASVGYDLDCGYENNNLDGYNVSIQFLVYEVNGTNSGANATGPINYGTGFHYIQGWVEDNHFITLTNFTESNATHYDFYWYATWVDGEGQNQMLERTWLNREINA